MEGAKEVLLTFVFKMAISLIMMIEATMIVTTSISKVARGLFTDYWKLMAQTW